MDGKLQAQLARVGRAVRIYSHWKRKQFGWRFAIFSPEDISSFKTFRGWAKQPWSKGLADLFQLNLSRIQFTSDILPADILGVFNPR